MARKEFVKGEKRLESSHFDLAAQHLEKAVTEYDKYAAAWNDLGTVYARSGRPKNHARLSKRRSQQTRTIFLPIWASLNSKCKIRKLSQPSKPQEKLWSWIRASRCRPSLNTVGYFKLSKSAGRGEKRANYRERAAPDHVGFARGAHAQIFLQKQDYPDAAAQMRAYLKEVPQGRYVDEMKKDLQQIEKSEADAGAKPDSAQTKIAP